MSEKIPKAEKTDSRQENPLAERYDETYRNPDVFGGGIPEDVIITAAEMLPPNAEVLELGAGQGRHAIVLAERGFKVTAKDISSVGIETIQKIAQEKALNIKAEVADITQGIEGQYDLIVSTYVLHHLSQEQAEWLIKDMQAHTYAGGLHALVLFQESADVQNKANRFMPTMDALNELYKDWEIVACDIEPVRMLQKKTDGTHMQTTKISFLVRKPISAT
jgi:tellurite methyltransferase